MTTSTSVLNSAPSALASVPLWIEGRPTAAQSVAIRRCHQPRNRQDVRVVPFANAADVDAAVAAATAAFPAVARHAAGSPRAYPDAVPRAGRAHQKAIAAVISEEHGKVFLDAMGEVQRGIEVVEFACGAPHLLKGAHSESVGRGVDAHSRLAAARRLRGNHAVQLSRRWCRCGCFRSRWRAATPSSSSRRRRIRQPACTWRSCSRKRACPTASSTSCTATGKRWTRILRHPGIQAVSFVGSTPVAKHVYATAAAHGKRVQALGGAKNHAVVLPDADLGIHRGRAARRGIRIGGRALHGHFGRRRGRRHWRCARRQRLASARAVSRSAPDRPRAWIWDRSSPPRTATG